MQRLRGEGRATAPTWRSSSSTTTRGRASAPAPGRAACAASGCKDGKEVRPIVTNTCNFSRPAGDAPALLTLGGGGDPLPRVRPRAPLHPREAALRGLGPTPARLRGAALADHGELGLPSRRSSPPTPATGRPASPSPQALVAKLQASATFDQGFKNVEYLAAALLDLEWHTLSAPAEARRGGARADGAGPHGDAAADRAALPHHLLPARLRAGRRLLGRLLQLQVGRGARRRRLRRLPGEGALRPGHRPRLPRRCSRRGGSEDPMELYVDFRGRSPRSSRS